MSQKQDKINQLKSLFPEAVKEGEIDYAALKQSIESDPLVNKREDKANQINEGRKRKRADKEKKQLEEYKRAELEEKLQQEEYEKKEFQKKIFAAVGAAIITLILIYYFGLLGVGFLGLIAAGLIKK